MNSLSLEVQFNVLDENIISPNELIDLYLYGVKIQNADGTEMPFDTIRTWILDAQQQLEGKLNIRFVPQIISEKRDFFRNDFVQYNYIRTSFPVRKPLRVEGYLNTVRQIQYPTEWLSIKENNFGLYTNHIYLVPLVGGSAQYNSIVYQGITPHLNFLGQQFLPNYWSLEYVSGMDKLPHDIINFVGMFASINIFAIMGDLILGAGIASSSLGIDGLSQSISTTSSATNSGYGSRIVEYRASLKEALPRLVGKYCPIPIMSF